MKDRFDALVEHLLDGNIFLPEAVEILEKGLIQRSLERNGGNQSVTAKLLGIHRNTLQRKIEEYGVNNGRHRARKPALREARTPGRKRHTA